MEVKKQNSVADKTIALRAKLSERRVSASRKFSDFEERASVAPDIAVLSRDESLKAMLSRIRVNARNVVYGEATLA